MVDTLKIIVGGFVILPLIMIVGAYLLMLWIAGMIWVSGKIDDFLCRLFWGE